MSMIMGCRTTALLLSLAWKALAVYDASSPGPCEGCTAVFYSGLNGSKCFRIPTIIKTHQGTLLAFAENRKIDCKDENSAHHDLVVRRSTDLGKTWGPLSIVREGEVPCPGCPAAISNPNPVEVRFPDGSYKILLHYDTLNGPQKVKKHEHGFDMQVWSLDDGVTWTNATVTNFAPPVVNHGGLIGPSVGLQGASGTIYFSARPVPHRQPGGSFLYWSKDFGKTWIPSPFISPNSETSIAWLFNSTDERIIMSIRSGKQRSQVIFDKDGKPGPVTYPPGLTDAGCQGSLINQAGALFLSNAASTKSRSHMTVKRSRDQGSTWSAGTLVWEGPSAYSQLVDLDGMGKLGLLFEAGKEKSHETISFVTLQAPEEHADSDDVVLV